MGHSTSPCKKRMNPKGQRKVTKVNAETFAENKRCLGVIAGFGTHSDICFVALTTNIVEFIHLACINQRTNYSCTDIII